MEIMIVVAVIALLAAFAIPNLLRARHNANETAAIGAMRTLSSALEMYRAAQNPPAYPLNLSLLSRSSPPYVSPTLTGGVPRQGYVFTYTRITADQYLLNASPQAVGTTGSRYFYVDDAGIVRASSSGPAGPTDPEIE